MEPDLLDNPAAGPAAVRGGLIRVAGYIIGVAVTTVSAAVLFRHLGVRDAGRFVLVLSIVNLAAGVVDAGLGAVGIREWATRAAAERRRLLANVLALRIAFTVVGILGAIGYAIAAGLSDRLVGATAIAGAGVLVANLQNAYATPLMATLELLPVTLLDLLKQVATAVGIVALAIAGAGLIPFFGIAPAAGVIAVVATLVLVRGRTPVLPRLDPAVWRPLVKQILPFALAVAVAAVYFRLSILLVDQLSTERQTGLYAASFRILEVLILLPQLAVGAALPIFSRAARDDTERLRYGLGLVTEAMAICGLALALSLAAAAPVAIEVVAGDDFEDAVPVLRIHAVALLFTFMTAPFSYALLALRRHRDIVVATLIAVAALALAIALLVPDHGARGAAWATLIGEATMTAAFAWLTARAGIPLKLTRLPRIAIAAALGAVPAVLLPAIPAAIAALVVFGGALLALRAIPDEVRQLR